MIEVRPVRLEESGNWERMRGALWPEEEAGEHAEEVARFFTGDFPRGPWQVLVAQDPTGRLLGFAELSIRPYAEGCAGARVAYLEGWFVEPAARRRGVGRALVEAAEAWGRGQGCSEFASDTDPGNTASLAAHRALGFEDVGLVRCFRKPLGSGRPRPMDPLALQLVDPDPSLVAEYLDMAEEWRASGVDKFPRAFEDFGAFVQGLRDRLDPERLAPGRVPQNSYWLVDGEGRVLGTSSLRQRLIPSLEKEGGHIGYDIRPSARRRGHGTAILALTLEKAREQGLEQVLVTCDDDNLGSVRIIEKNGGQLVGKDVSDHSGKPIRRYTIDL